MKNFVFMSKIVGIIADFVENDKATPLNVPFYRVRQSYINYIQRYLKQDVIVIIIPYLQNKIDEYVRICDGVLLVGGDDLPPKLYGEDELFDNVFTNDTRYDFELEFIKKYVYTNKPLLGICAGMQSINVAFGGNLYQDIDKQLKTDINHSQKNDFSKPTHDVFVDVKSKLFEILNIDKISTNSMHHQAVKKLGEGLAIGAKTNDGVIEEIELSSHKCFIGLQWHPELCLSSFDNTICEYFCSCL